MDRKLSLERIKGLREKHGISQKQLADLLHISPPSVSNWEHGKTRPTKANLQTMAKLFGVSIDYLMGADRPMTFGIVSPSKEELMTVLEKHKGLPDREFDMVVSLMNFFIAVHDGGRIRYAEMCLLDDYADYLQQTLSSAAEKELPQRAEALSVT